MFFSSKSLNLFVPAAIASAALVAIPAAIASRPAATDIRLSAILLAGASGHDHHHPPATSEDVAGPDHQAHQDHDGMHQDDSMPHGEEPGSMEHGGEHHNHAPLSVPSGMPAPTLDLVVNPDPVEGWNLELKTTNFRFAPENVNGPSSTDEGHAHISINGEKMGRIYSNWYHLPALPPGTHTIRVELNANGHEPLFYQGEAIADSEVITVVAGE
ncbi:MAG: hypothetical protein AAGF66_02775 [Cyanobacteria bacterium P01_H01_bin.119]